jgi:hypothetical protein
MPDETDYDVWRFRRITNVGNFTSHVSARSSHKTQMMNWHKPAVERERKDENEMEMYIIYALFFCEENECFFPDAMDDDK